jgi:hypothetical protein
MKKQIKPGYITSTEAAIILGKDQKFLSNDRYKTQKIPFIKSGMSIFYKKEDILAYKEVLYSNARIVAKKRTATSYSNSKERFKKEIMLIVGRDLQIKNEELEREILLLKKEIHRLHVPLHNVRPMHVHGVKEESRKKSWFSRLLSRT